MTQDAALVLRDKVAVVTGGNRNIGYALSLGLACAGARVLVANRDAASGEAAAERLRGEGHTAASVQTDVSRLDSCRRMAQYALTLWGQIDILVNNAAVVVSKKIVDHTIEDFDFVMNVNVRGVLNCCQSVYAAMRDQRRGRIINVGSLLARRGAVNRAVYAASKAAVIALTKGLALEWAPDGITVNSLSPGVVVAPDQPGHESAPRSRASIEMIPLQRLSRPEDLVGLCVYLASDASSYLTGQDILVDGGWSLATRPLASS